MTEDFGNWTVEDARAGRCQIEDIGDPRPLEIPPEPEPAEVAPIGEETAEELAERHRLEVIALSGPLRERALNDLRAGGLSLQASLSVLGKLQTLTTKAVAETRDPNADTWTEERRQAKLASITWMSASDWERRLSYAGNPLGRGTKPLVEDATPKAIEAPATPIPAPAASGWKEPPPFSDAAAKAAGREALRQRLQQGPQLPPASNDEALDILRQAQQPPALW